MDFLIPVKILKKDLPAQPTSRYLPSWVSLVLFKLVSLVRPSVWAHMGHTGICTSEGPTRHYALQGEYKQCEEEGRALWI